MFSVELDHERRIVVITTTGQWTLEQLARFEQSAGGIYATFRRTYGPLRLLVDKSQGAVIAKEMVQPLVEIGVRLGQPDDRIATVVTSSLMKLQMKRMLPESLMNVFVSREAAIMWLTAHDEVAAA